MPNQPADAYSPSWPIIRIFELAADGKSAELRKVLAEESVESVCVMDSGGRTPLNLAILSSNLDAVKVGTFAHLASEVALPQNARKVHNFAGQKNVDTHSSNANNLFSVLTLLFAPCRLSWSLIRRAFTCLMQQETQQCM